MKNIKLTFRNQSNDNNNSQIVLFQKAVKTDFEELAVAWKVIENCGQNEFHPFDFPMLQQVCMIDSWGNYSAPIDAYNGDVFSVALNPSGTGVGKSTDTCSPLQIDVRNDLSQGSIDAAIYKDNRLLALKSGVAPGQKAVFELQPVLWIAVVSEVEEGDMMDSAILSDQNTPLNLLGIRSADIIMTGGGFGPQAKGYSFALDNIQRS